LRAQPRNGARSIGVTFGIATAFPFCGVSGLRIVVPNDRFFAIIGPQINAIPKRAPGKGQDYD
jgi:hypothetical protein